MGFRVAPPDVGHMASAFFDDSAGAVARLSAQCRRWDIARGENADGLVAKAGSRKLTGPHPVSTSHHWPPTPSSAAAAAEDQVDVVIDEDVGADHAMDPGTAAALDNLLSQPLAVVDLDKYTIPTPLGTPTVEPGALRRGMTGIAGGATPGQFVPGAPERPPDSAADLSVVTPMRIFADLASSGETGLLRFEISPHIKEVYLVRGAPESIDSSLRTERFGEYLVARGFLRADQLQATLAELPRFSGKLGDTLVGLGIMRPLDVFRLLSEQVRERVMEIFRWVQGRASFYRGVSKPQGAFPLGLDPFEILGAGVLTLPYDYLERRFLPALEMRPHGFSPPRIVPEAFRLGPTPREVWSMLDGTRTVRDWMARFTSPDELVTFLRTLYLLVETGLVAMG
jgi:hypothetical protein